MEIHMWLANLAWVLLIAVMVVRPLCNITGWNILKKGMKYRQQIGIASGLAAICYVLVYGIMNRLGMDFWLGPVWSLQTLLGWGMLALVCLLLPLLTSNHYSQKLLKNNWKNVQRLSYLFFIFTAIHILFIAGDWWYGVEPLLVWAIVWIWAKIKKERKCMIKNLINN